MSLTTKNGCTNTTANTHTLTPIDLGLTTNYSGGFEDGSYIMNNKTNPLDQGERLTYRYQELSKVSTSQPIAYPSKMKNGMQYVIKLEEILRTTDADGEIVQDEPLVMYLTVRHQRTGTITAAHVDAALARLLGEIIKDDGTSRFGDMMRGAIQPVTE